MVFSSFLGCTDYANLFIKSHHFFGRNWEPEKDAPHIIQESVFGGEKMLYSEFKTKEVINIKDCKRLGRVTDFEFDECSGQICKIIVSCGCSFFDWFKCESDYTILWRDIKQVGPDIILVDVKDNCHCRR